MFRGLVNLNKLSLYGNRIRSNQRAKKVIVISIPIYLSIYFYIYLSIYLSILISIYISFFCVSISIIQFWYLPCFYTAWIHIKEKTKRSCQLTDSFNPCSKCLLHSKFWERIYPGTAQILFTINVNTLIQSRKSKGTILSLFIKTGNHRNTIHDLSTPRGAILLAIDINQKLLTIDPKLKGAILNLFVKTGKDYSLAVKVWSFYID